METGWSTSFCCLLSCFLCCMAAVLQSHMLVEEAVEQLPPSAFCSSYKNRNVKTVSVLSTSVWSLKDGNLQIKVVQWITSYIRCWMVVIYEITCVMLMLRPEVSFEIKGELLPESPSMDSIICFFGFTESSVGCLAHKNQCGQMADQ